ncbi:60S acidic ribosomal protein P2 isoform B [Alligator mississippiensis]|uniref:Large ribosomal subunit protein P2 n=1 Tax=Alligator mississippiensis TaxID=8496 RepID=A0A151NXJ6_ALLMI|nr:60S acidic ribosomal protein P2 isoform B [Alligator mississippiensis]
MAAWLVEDTRCWAQLLSELPFPPSVKMRYVAAYLLAILGGNESPTSKDLKKILDSVGIETDDERVNKVISELNGKNIEDVIAQGNSKLASMPAGGAVAVAAGAGSAAPAGGAAPAAAIFWQFNSRDSCLPKSSALQRK